jgi:dTDP-4-dehydrorhamnose reductase
MAKNKVLITGADGMLGSMLQNLLSKEKGIEFVGTDISTLDITKEEEIKEIISSHSPAFLINCAAYTDVNQAEVEVELSNMINGYAVGYLAKYCQKNKIKFLHISTDYIFDESSKPRNEDSDPKEGPQNQYGKSKLLGEKEAIKNNKGSYIIRVSWTFGPNRKNFIDTMIALAKEKQELSIVTDEVGVPTYTKDVSKSLIEIINNIGKYKPGFYHAVSEEYCSRYEEAKKIFELAKINIKLNKIKLKDFPRKVQIPHFSVLANNKLPKLPRWDKAIEEYLKDRNSNNI